MTLRKLVSGGQTGADRAALDAALAAGFPCGGWCPEGRMADDGPLAAKYPLDALEGAGYRQRTIANVRDSDGTAIFYFRRPLGGTELTLSQCLRLRRPYQLIDASLVTPDQAGALLLDFVEEYRTATLNVAGPGERRNPGIHAYVLAAVGRLLRDM